MQIQFVPGPQAYIKIIDIVPGSIMLGLFAIKPGQEMMIPVIRAIIKTFSVAGDHQRIFCSFDYSHAVSPGFDPVSEK